jgi:hypothetical protein
MMTSYCRWLDSNSNFQVWGAVWHCRPIVSGGQRLQFNQAASYQASYLVHCLSLPGEN